MQSRFIAREFQFAPTANETNAADFTRPVRRTARERLDGRFAIRRNFQPSLKDIQRALSLGAANQPRNEKILRYHEALLLTRTGRFEDALRSYSFFTRDEDSKPELLMALGLESSSRVKKE